MGELFVQTVARNRNLSAAAVRKTQATTFLGAAGVEIGFADAVMAPDEAFESLLAELG
jgi:ClpP class serine protease